MLILLLQLESHINAHKVPIAHLEQYLLFLARQALTITYISKLNFLTAYLAHSHITVLTEQVSVQHTILALITTLSVLQDTFVLAVLIVQHLQMERLDTLALLALTVQQEQLHQYLVVLDTTIHILDKALALHAQLPNYAAQQECPLILTVQQAAIVQEQHQLLHHVL